MITFQDAGMIKISNVTKSFGTNEVLHCVSFDIAEGDIFGIVGHSGAGKSTILRCLNGLERYDSGSIKVMDREVCDLDTQGLKNLRRDMGMIFQNFNLLSRKNVYDNIAFPLEVWGMPKERIRERVDELLELVELPEKRQERVSNLSGGQMQRVGIARALALNPKILLSDEATSALDPRTTLSILDLLQDINRRFNLTIVVVTHQMEVIKRICNKVAILEQGKVIACGRTEELFMSPPKGLQHFIRDEYTVIPEGINLRVVFPSDTAKRSIIADIARETGADFSIIGGQIERYRDSMLGILMLNIQEQHLAVVEKALTAHGLLWEIMEDDAQAKAGE